MTSGLQISPGLYQRIRTVLLNCGPFQSDDTLAAMFVDARIAQWRTGLPEAQSDQQRVEAVIAFLYYQNSPENVNGLLLLLNVLRKRVDTIDTCYDELGQLAEELQSEIKNRVDGVKRHNPYRGLEAFRAEEHHLFFGREQVTAKLLKTVRQKSFVAILGPSGSGKSSLLFAGLLPQIRAEVNTFIFTLRIGQRPFRNVTDTLIPHLATNHLPTTQLEESEKLAQALAKGQTKLSELITILLAQNDEYQRCLLVIDQFEELYTLAQNDEQRPFMHMLSQANASNFTILLTMRIDFLEQATAYRPFTDILQDAIYILSPMTKTEYRQVIEKPAQQAGVFLETGLATRIIDDLSEAPGNLPLLAFTLTLLWEQQENWTLSHAAYENIGGVAGALTKHAEDVFDDLSQPQKEQVQRIFMQMVHFGENVAYMRRVTSRAELGEANWALVQRMADKRLIVTGEGGTGTAEIAHEALITHWQTLHGWIEKNHAFLIWREQLRFATFQWQKSHQQDEGSLLRGLALIEAETYLAERRQELSPDEQVFIGQSIILRQRERRKKLRQKWLKRGMVIGISFLILILFNVGMRTLAWRPLFDEDEIEAITFVASKSPTYYIGSKDTGLYISRDGQKWQNFRTNLPEGSSTGTQNKRPIRLLAVDSQNSSRIFAHVKDNGLWYLELSERLLTLQNEKQSWQAANQGLPLILTNTLFIDLDIAGQLGTTIVISQSFRTGILYISRNGGKSWQTADTVSCNDAQIPSNIRATHINATQNEIYAGAQGGLYRIYMQDNCLAWQQVAPLLQVWAIEADQENDTFYMVASSGEDIATDIPIYRWQANQPEVERLTAFGIEPFKTTINPNAKADDILFTLLADNTIHVIQASGKTRMLYRPLVTFPLELTAVPHPSGTGLQLWLGSEAGLYAYRYIR